MLEIAAFLTSWFVTGSNLLEGGFNLFGTGSLGIDTPESPLPSGFFLKAS